MSSNAMEGAARRRDERSRIIAAILRATKLAQAAPKAPDATVAATRAFELNLLRFYAERRMASAPAMAAGAALLAMVALRWTLFAPLCGWFVACATGTGLTYALARDFCGRTSPIDLRWWSRAFTAAEILQGAIWATLVLVMEDARDPEVATFAMISLLLVAAMNATVTAPIPSAVYGALAPFAATILLTLRPIGASDGMLVFVILTLGTLLVFVHLARKLRESTVQALALQAEKDALIAEFERGSASSDLARSRAEESNLAKSRFLATMSHELRTPLNAILGFSEIMKSELFGAHAVAAYKGYSTDIHASGEHLLLLINEILDLSRVEAGRYDLHEEAVDLLDVIEDCRHLMMLRAKKKDIVLRQVVTGVLPRLWADKRAMRQIVLNLLSNAVKFTPDGGTVSIALGTKETGGQFVAISDTGIGIPDCEIPTVMASFGRGALAQKSAEEGTGLGLPIAKGLVEVHGGTFTLRSKVGEGTSVTVSFPATRVISALEPLPFDGDDPVFPPAPPSLRSAA